MTDDERFIQAAMGALFRPTLDVHEEGRAVEATVSVSVRTFREWMIEILAAARADGFVVERR